MCITSAPDVLARLRIAATVTLGSIKQAAPDDSAGTIAAGLSAMLQEGSPLVTPLPDPLSGQITPERLLKYKVEAYPTLLARVIGPPLQLGRGKEVGYVGAECALAALRRGRLQSALTMLFLSTLCTSEMDDAAVEAVHHLLLETDMHGSIGLMVGGMRRSGIGEADRGGLRQRLDGIFLTTAVQLLGTWGRTV